MEESMGPQELGKVVPRPQETPAVARGELQIIAGRLFENLNKDQQMDPFQLIDDVRSLDEVGGLETPDAQGQWRPTKISEWLRVAVEKRRDAFKREEGPILKAFSSRVRSAHEAGDHEAVLRELRVFQVLGLLPEESLLFLRDKYVSEVLTPSGAEPAVEPPPQPEPQRAAPETLAAEAATAISPPSPETTTPERGAELRRLGELGTAIGEAFYITLEQRLKDPQFAGNPLGAVDILHVGLVDKLPLFEQVLLQIARRGYTPDAKSLRRLYELIDETKKHFSGRELQTELNRIINAGFPIHTTSKEVAEATPGELKETRVPAETPAAIEPAATPEAPPLKVTDIFEPKPAFTASLPPEIQARLQTWWEQYTKAIGDRDYESVARLQHELVPILNTTLPESAKILTKADYDKYRVPTFPLFHFLPESAYMSAQFGRDYPGNPSGIDLLRQLTARTSPVLNQALENYLQACQQHQSYKSGSLGEEIKIRVPSDEEGLDEQLRSSYLALRDQWQNILSTDPELVARVQQADAESLTAFRPLWSLEDHLKNQDQTVTLDEFVTAFITCRQAQDEKFRAEQQLTRHQNQQLADMADQAGLKLVQPDREIPQPGWKGFLLSRYEPYNFLILVKKPRWWEKAMRWVFTGGRWVLR